MELFFDKNEFARLLEKAKGSRSINQYALLSQVSATYISKLLRGIVEKPPGAVVIKKLADKAQNGITYEELMQAAGHLPRAYNINRLYSELKEDSPDYNFNYNTITIPVVGTPATGALFPAPENIEDYMDFPKTLAAGATFAFKIKGNNMTDVGICDGDYVIVKQQPAAESGQTVVARVNDTVTVKRLYKLDGKMILEPADGNYKPIEAQNIDIIGVVTVLIRKFFD